MAEFEEKLNSILGNQEAMGQIMALAHSLSTGEREGEQTPPSPQPHQEEQQEQPDQGTPDLSALLGQLDPGMIQLGMRLLGVYRGRDDRNAALLSALRPFVREERRSKLDRAIEIARVTRLVRVALEAMGGKGEDGDV